MAEYPQGFQIGPDGKRHALADLGTVRESTTKAASIRVFGDPVHGGVPTWNAETERCEWSSGGGSEVTLHASAARTATGTTTGVAAPGNSARLDLVVSAIVGTNEVQTVTVTGSPTGGTFTLTYSGQTTAAIAYDATASAVQSALEALSNIAVGDVAVTGSAGGPYTVTFTGALGSTNVAQLTSTPSLTGGSSPSVTHATTTAGVAPTFDVAVQTASTQGGSYSTVASFAQKTATGSEHKVFSGIDEYVRLSYTLGAGTTSVTFAVTGEVV